jgi:hypothetical protein
VSAYKSCIEDFVRQQEDAATIHRRAASEAISEWNDFVTNDSETAARRPMKAVRKLAQHRRPTR